MNYLVGTLSPSDYLRAILQREAVDETGNSALRRLETEVTRLVSSWGGRHLLEVYPGGAFEKGHANRSGISIDFVVSIGPETPHRMVQIYESLHAELERQGLRPIRRNVTITIDLGGAAVDLLPAKRESLGNDVHEIYSARRNRSMKTNLSQHIFDAVESMRREEVRILKLWRDQNGLHLPSYYLELSVYAALRRRPVGDLADNVWVVLGYFASQFVARGILDPTNANTVVSDEMTAPERLAVAEMARSVRAGLPWSAIVR